MAGHATGFARQDAPTRTPTTAEELILWPDDDPGDIVEGVFVPKYGPGEPCGEVASCGLVASELGWLIGGHVWAHRLGAVAMRAGFRLCRAPDTVRVSALSFVAAARLAAGIPDGVFEGAPDLAVEVLSPATTPTKAGVRIADYLRYRARAAWAADPAAGTIAVHVRGETARVLHGDDVLSGEGVLPGFAVAASAVFAILDRL